jgi:hypothetical protein
VAYLADRRIGADPQAGDRNGLLADRAGVINLE